MMSVEERNRRERERRRQKREEAGIPSRWSDAMLTERKKRALLKQWYIERMQRYERYERQVAALTATRAHEPWGPA